MPNMSAGSTDFPAQRILGVSSFSVLRCSRTSSSARSGTCSHLFCGQAGQQTAAGGEGGGGTDNEQHVGVLRLHARRDARVFVAGKVLCVDDGDDCVKREGTRSLALEFAYLEREGSGKGRTAMRRERVSGCERQRWGGHLRRLDDDSVWTELFCAAVSEGR